MMLHDALELSTAGELRARLVTYGAKGRPRKGDMIAALEHLLLDEDLGEIWQRLSEIEREAVAESVHRWGGTFCRSCFEARYGSVPSHFDPDRPYRFGRTATEPSLLALLFYKGEVPDDLAARLAGVCPPPPELAVTTLDDDALPASVPAGPDAHRSEPEPESLRRVDTEQMVRQDLPAVLRLVGQGRVSVGAKTGVPGSAAIKRIESVLAGGDWYSADDDTGIQRWAGGPIRPIRPFAWPLLLQAGGLARQEGSKLALTARGTKALSQPAGEVVAGLFERWQKKGTPDELRRVDLVKGQTSRSAQLTAVTERRRGIAAALRAICPPGRWIAVDELFRQVLYQGLRFPVAHQLWSLYLVDTQYGALGYADSGAFEVLDARYCLAYLFEYLATLGMIDVAYTRPYGARPDYRDLWGTDELLFLSRYDGLRFIRLNGLGAYCLGLTPEYRPTLPARPPLLSIGEDLVIETLREPEPAERIVLERIAQARDDGRWILDTGALLAASADETARADIRGFLDAAVDGGLPPRLAELLDGLAERATAVADVGPARMIRCREPGLATTLATDPATAPHCSRAGERLLCVPERKLAAFRKGVSRLGLILPEQPGV